MLHNSIVRIRFNIHMDMANNMKPFKAQLKQILNQMMAQKRAKKLHRDREKERNANKL